MPRLYHCCDARSFRCLWLIHEMSLSGSVDVVMLSYPPRDAAFLRVNPLGTVPTFHDGPIVMTESIAILHYLLTMHGAAALGMRPDEPDYGRWLDWMVYGEASLLAPQTALVHARSSTGSGPVPKSTRAGLEDYLLARVGRVAFALEDGRDYLCGGRFTAADISVGYALDVANYLALTDRMPHDVQNYSDRLRKRSAYRDARRHQAALSCALTGGGYRRTRGGLQCTTFS